MGIQINGITDTILATDGSLVVSGQQLTGVTDISASGIVTATQGYVVGTGASIFSPAANTLALGTNGSERVRVDSSGRLAIGTTSAGSNLHVSGTTGYLFLVDSTTRDTTLAAYADATSIRLIAQNNARTGFKTLNLDGSDIRFLRGGSECARIDDSSRLLVGTSSARTAFQISTGFGNVTPVHQFEYNSQLYNGLSITHNSGANSYPAALAFGKSRGSSAGSYTSVASGDFLGWFDFYGADGTNMVRAANIHVAVDGTPGTNDMPGRLVFETTADGASSPTERFRVTNDGQTWFGATTNTSPGTVNRGFFIRNETAGKTYLQIASTGTTSDTLVYFYNGNGLIGDISTNGGTVSYNSFLGSHWGALTDWTRPDIKVGTILEAVNELIDWKYAIIEVNGEQKKICYNGIESPGSTVLVEYQGQTYEGVVELESNPDFAKAVKVKINETPASKAVYGVFVGWNSSKEGDGGVWNDMYVGAVGNYVVRMAAGQNPEIGDLVEADGTGCAVVQDDDIIRTKTVAKITSTISQMTYDDGSFLVTCVLYCG